MFNNQRTPPTLPHTGSNSADYSADYLRLKQPFLGLLWISTRNKNPFIYRRGFSVGGAGLKPATAWV